MEDILYLDIETDKKGKPRDFGAVMGTKELHEKHVARLSVWIEESNYICGHNIIAHDIPVLEKMLSKDIASDKQLIDTLLWSPLIFSENPYHHLVKGYKLVNESDVNNPLSDSKLTRGLLNDELNGFGAMDELWQQCLYILLADDERYNSFFDFLPPLKATYGIGPVKALFEGRVCSSVAIEELVRLSPVELAYVLAVIRLNSTDSVLPKWVSESFPRTKVVFDELRFTSCSNPDCSYCNTHLNPKAALKQYFGYADFRKFDPTRKVSLQEETVKAGVNGESFVAVFPTGGGKSLTFQLPALMKGAATGELTVVISPLVSLMKDQVENLSDRFQIHNAISINGLLSPLEREEAFERVENGFAQLLYLSPESLRSPSILRLLRSREIARFVIDEAHCFSSWGQDFRVDYLYIAEFIKLVQGLAQKPMPVSCFTATAKPKVIEDIKKYFQEKLGLYLEEYLTNSARENLTYEVIEVKDEMHKMQELLKLMKSCHKPAIIYASRTKKVEEVAGALNASGLVECTYFHGQLDNEEKKNNMDAFMGGNIDVIVATSAFGMGVDKDNVHTVIHYNISDSLENYTQEAGRAGRDASIKAKCYVLFNTSDLSKHFSLLQQSKLNKKEIEGIWGAIKRLTKYRSKVSQSALEIAKMAGWDSEMNDLETRVKTAIAALEDTGFLRRTQNSPAVFADSLLVSSYSKGIEKIEAAKALSEDDKKDCGLVLKRIVTDDDVRLDYIADRIQLRLYRVQEVIQMLRELHILGDAKDLTAFVNVKSSKNSSINVAQRFIELEAAIHKKLDEYANSKFKISLRELNQGLIDDGISSSSMEDVLRILDYWEVSRFINKSRLDRDKGVYELTFLNREGLDEELAWRHDLTKWVVDYLSTKAQNDSRNDVKDEALTQFSLLELKQSNTILGLEQETNLRRYERVLLFLNRMKSIKLEGGFMITYNRINIEDVKSTEKRHFMVSDYDKLGTFYQQRTEQIHIVGEYAKKSVENYEAALVYVNDYFTLEYEDFLAKYFSRRISEIRRALTPERFKEIIQNLDVDQTSVLRDNSSKNILVLAGPGAGKTKILVHKIAQLLLIEDVKPEQFMMLTFSKAASMEFKNRIRRLVPEFSGLIKISTFHGFCFETIGQIGDLRKSENIVRESLEMLRSGDIDLSQITNKSVLMLDEFQDISGDEWELIQFIIETAGNIRVVAVGDDDQNIYEFRGSSNKYLRSFKEEYKAEVYTMVKNYRSIPDIVAFNNKFLQRIPNRLKMRPLEAVIQTHEPGVYLNKYESSYLSVPVANDVGLSDLKGTKAVLVKSNEEALLVSTLLKSKGVKTKLLAGFEGFKTAQLYEIRMFTASLLKQKSGLILEVDWLDAVEQFKEQWTGNLHFEPCIKVINNFSYSYPNEKLFQHWLDYIREIKMEDVVHPEEESVIVSTMHKAKGKEFDHVWLMLDEYAMKYAEDKRVVYVACTRAKRSLLIHTNMNFFDGYLEQGRLSNDNAVYDPPKVYDVVLGHRDINLSSIKWGKAKKALSQIQTDTTLEVVRKKDDGELLGLGLNKYSAILTFSKAFMEKKVARFENQGYELQIGKVEYRVNWFDMKEGKEYELVLPKLRFRRVTSNNSGHLLG